MHPVFYVLEPRVAGSCDGTFDDSSNYATNPDYQSNSNDWTNNGNDQNCNWTITAPSATRISLAFLHLNLKDKWLDTETCDGYGDLRRIEIFDGKDESATSLGQFCGNKPPADILSSGNNLYLEYTTEGGSQSTKQSLQGFRIFFNIGKYISQNKLLYTLSLISSNHE